MSKFSRDKGKRGEREVIDFLQPWVEQAFQYVRDCGFDVGDTPVLQRNTLQSDRGGVDVAGLHGFALEIKNCATLQLDAWWQQTVKQAGKRSRPVLIYKLARRGWRVRCLAPVGVPSRLGTVAAPHWHWMQADIALESFGPLFASCVAHDLMSNTVEVQ